MPKRVIDLRDQKPLLDMVTHARKGRQLTPEQYQRISLTIRRVPEVMVKVSGGAHSLAGVKRHMKYIGRDGELGMETDLSTHVGGPQFEQDLAEDWDLDLETLSRQSERGIRRRRPGKLVHNLIFSMPPGTPPKKVLEAVRKLAINEWQQRHRYAMALHTDTDHPHVHVVLKAVSEQGERLNIRKATLRSWRSQFAAHLRELGVPANATERAVRGQTRISQSDARFRMDARQHIPGMPDRSHRAGAHSVDAGGVPNAAIERMRRTRVDVLDGWHRTAALLRARGDHTVADLIRAFTLGMKQPGDGLERTTDADRGGARELTHDYDRSR